MDPNKSYNIDGDTDHGGSEDELSSKVSSESDAGADGVGGKPEGAPLFIGPIPRAKPALKPGEAKVYFEADALGRQYKTDLIIGKRIGKFGPREGERQKSNSDC